MRERRRDPAGRAAHMALSDAFLAPIAARVVGTEKMRAALRQDRVWTDRQGTEIALSDIDERYARNILGFLEKRAAVLHAGAHEQYLFLPEPRGDVANDSFHDEHTALMFMEPKDWLESQPFVHALRTRVAELETAPSAPKEAR